MKAVILAGGLGTRISEETHLKPKPMIEIGGMPIIWHIMKIYSFYGINEFIICCGYKGYIIKEFFSNYSLHSSDIKCNFSSKKIEILNKNSENWEITLIDTGLNTMTGGRLKRIRQYIDNETFCLTYGDGVSDVDISLLLEFHKKNKSLATLTAVKPPARFGALDIDNENIIRGFKEKPIGSTGWINGGFFVMEPCLLIDIENDETVLEYDILPKLSKQNKLSAFKHNGFWQPMDTLRDKVYLEKLWNEEKALWKKW